MQRLFEENNLALSLILGQALGVLIERLKVEVAPREFEHQDGRSFPCHPRQGGAAKELRDGVEVPTERTRFEVPLQGLNGYQIKRGDILAQGGQRWEIYRSIGTPAGWELEATAEAGE